VKKKLWRLLLTLAMAVATLSAGAITVDGQWNDWTSYSGTSDSNWNQTSAANNRLSTEYRFVNDPDNDAYGGQNYDIEQLFYYYEDIDANTLSGGTLYIGLITGYEPNNSTYKSGDMFIDLGGDNTFDLAVATGTESSSRFEDIWENDGWTTTGVVISSHSGANPYRVNNSASGATPYGSATIDWDYGVGPGSSHNFLEMSLNVTGSLESLLATGIGLHWTMECGNDAINVLDNSPMTTIPPPPQPPLNPVPLPAPAAMALLGMGTLAGIRRLRQPKAA
jgi:hypothetical protein